MIRQPRPAPPLALSEPERQALHDVLCGERFADCAPSTIYAMLLYVGVYLTSVRTMYRLLAANDQTHERRNQRTRLVDAKPELLATGPNQVLSWDITKIKAPTRSASATGGGLSSGAIVGIAAAAATVVGGKRAAGIRGTAETSSAR